MLGLGTGPRPSAYGGRFFGGIKIFKNFQFLKIFRRTLKRAP